MTGSISREISKKLKTVIFIAIWVIRRKSILAYNTILQWGREEAKPDICMCSNMGYKEKVYKTFFLQCCNVAVGERGS